MPSPRFAIDPRWDGRGVSPQAFLGLSCVLLQPLKDRVSRRILPIPPAPAVLDERVVDVGAIGQEHISKGASVLVEAVSQERDIVTIDQP